MKKYSFKITIEKIDATDENANLSFITHNHDDLIELAQRIGISTDAELSRLIGIKLFGEAMLEDRSNPLYADIFPEFGKFMKKFKANPLKE